MFRTNLIFLVFLSLPFGSMGQVHEDAFNSSRGKVGGSEVSAFNRGRASNFNDYRQKLNAQYVSLTREKWKDFNAFRSLTRPDQNEKPVPPVYMDDEEAKREQEGKRLDIGGVVSPVLDGGEKPRPVGPVQEQPEENAAQFSFTYLGTELKVRRPQTAAFRLAGTDEQAVADGWETLCGTAYNNMLLDCIRLRNSHGLCDWAYLQMLQSLGNAYCGAGTDEATLLAAYLFSQSGYRIRLGRDSRRLVLLYASRHSVYGTPYFEIDGDKFFPAAEVSGKISVNAAKYPKEQSLSLWVSGEPQVAFTATPRRTLTAKRYPDMSVTVSVNKNLLPFFQSYPSSEVGGNFMTRWAMYANTPLSREVREELYPQLRQRLNGLSEKEAAERLLNWVQTAFTYEYDDKIWGEDRAFFAEETLFYPYCDCEDRAILFTRLVRDLLGLKCLLIYYPGHLASAVSFPTQVAGDYIEVSGRRYTVADPTYIGASVGRTMPDMDNASAKVILLQ